LQIFFSTSVNVDILPSRNKSKKKDENTNKQRKP